MISLLDDPLAGSGDIVAESESEVNPAQNSRDTIPNPEMWFMFRNSARLS
jgi:hypothetical protein